MNFMTIDFASLPISKFVGETRTVRGVGFLERSDFSGANAKFYSNMISAERTLKCNNFVFLRFVYQIYALCDMHV
jgi:hypothetical protein